LIKVQRKAWEQEDLFQDYYPFLVYSMLYSMLLSNNCIFRGIMVIIIDGQLSWIKDY